MEKSTTMASEHTDAFIKSEAAFTPAYTKRSAQKQTSDNNLTQREDSEDKVGAVKQNEGQSRSELMTQGVQHIIRAMLVKQGEVLTGNVPSVGAKLYAEELLAQIRRDLRYEGTESVQADDRTRSAEVTIDWQDREDHKDFDVCADDHCQRYQGTGDGEPHRSVDDAVDSTRGEVLTFEGKICDARFSKCCGGMTEDFATCWDPREHPYLMAVEDPYCAEATPEILERSLNGYDREDTQTYRWSADYAPGEMEALLLQRSGIDFGEVTALKPLKRGKSGRICLLEIIGTRCSHIVGKELTIRRWLSASHLKSSAFEATRRPDGGWHLEGKGWGHGTGLCQIGAAVMASKGFGYREILQHYYPGAIIEKLY